MRAASLAALTALLVSPSAPAADEQADAIKSLLTKHKTWTMYLEYTDEPRPGDRAQKLRFEYVERDGKLMGRWLLEFGGCEFEISLSSDRFSFPWCPPYRGEPVLTYDRADAEFPFKNWDPRKLWLKPDK